MGRHVAADYVAAPPGRTAAVDNELARGTSGEPSPLVELARREVRERAGGEAGADGESTPTPRKVVSRRALEYLQLAQLAIDYTKGVIAYQGNQIDAIKASGGNSLYRTDTVRTRAWWQLTPEAQAIAEADPDAAVAAKAEYLGGGNCFEYAAVAYTYLRSLAKGVALQRVEYQGVDHVFVILGDIAAPQAFPDNELVVADAWPYTPRACLWEDHFVYNPDREGLRVAAARIGDGAGGGPEGNKALIMAGLSLTPDGLAQATTYASPELLADMMADTQGWGLWHQEDAARDTEYDYQNWAIDRLPMRPARLTR